MWSDSSSATRPSPSRASTSSGLPSGPCITLVPVVRLVSTSRNQWLQCGGSVCEPSSPRVTGWRLPGSVRRAWKLFSVTSPLGSAGRITSSGVRQMLVGLA